MEVHNSRKITQRSGEFRKSVPPHSRSVAHLLFYDGGHYDDAARGSAIQFAGATAHTAGAPITEPRGMPRNRTARGAAVHSTGPFERL